MKTEKPKVIIITGPTAVGKTRLSIQLAKQLDADVISADSMQIYKNCNIGTAKASIDEMEGITHHFIDICDTNDEFSVKEYKKMASEEIIEQHLYQKVSVVCGGTGLYINSIAYQLDFDERSTDENIRNTLYRLYDEEGIVPIRKMLFKFDPISFNKYHENDIKRNIRALEYFICSNVPFSSNQEGFRTPNDTFDTMLFVLNRDRQKLYNAIDDRVESMIANGLVEEVKSLLESGTRKDAQSMQAIGYKEVIQYLDGNFTYTEMIDKLKQHSRNYAKRQLTWFRNDPSAIFIDVDHLSEEEILNLILTEMKKQWKMVMTS
ncbi:MAG: tRNA (adenosine(37)-N6)-dimethylallyltransferase MiaA [Tissierellia bacterium]|nr:tRNA (adenosine(37)-N6)-dimethylallyltransferase MiaA [Tissierellia bacterium]